MHSILAVHRFSSNLSHINTNLSLTSLSRNNNFLKQLHLLESLLSHPAPSEEVVNITDQVKGEGIFGVAKCDFLKTLSVN